MRSPTRRNMSAAVLAALAVVFVGNSVIPVTMPPVPSSGPVACPQNALNAIRAMQPTDVPDHLRWGEPRQPSDFDVNRYFTVLHHLSLEQGYTLDWVYYQHFLGSQPVLYARKSGDAPYGTFPQYYQAVGDQDWHAYLDHIQADGTPEGYLEFVMLRIMADQFYLYWHAEYGDWEIVCGMRLRIIERIVAEGAQHGFGEPLSAEQVAAARALDLTPHVDVDGDTVRVGVVVFTKWGGFIRQTYSISRSFPHKTELVEEKTLVDYDCHFTF